MGGRSQQLQLGGSGPPEKDTEWRLFGVPLLLPQICLLRIAAHATCPRQDSLLALSHLPSCPRAFLIHRQLVNVLREITDDAAPRKLPRQTLPEPDSHLQMFA